ncbi:hypothetical protein CVT24_000752 [Panaeolus cyanescens]|uniref:WLM domain-containing protein n=1 Tax=Panaeolus cyanescens TaxID=181874 RepID=A0A409YCQ3_9AGAR|nr:hypothetical protein CVT24_000752 [Panaeolus cyanescens]
MVHHRINEKETNPNPHINFITALKHVDTDEQESARQLLRALAAQVRPIMKAHGFEVNSFEELYGQDCEQRYDNFKTKDTTGMVSRRLHTGETNKIHILMLYTLGYWSSGTRLSDSTRIGGMGIEEGDFPEYVCGGAQSRARPSSGHRKRRATGKRREVVPSLHTGAQTAKKRKAGSRVTSKYAFTGEGSTLGADTGPGTGFGKRANSKKAREERALATERRLLALQGQGSSKAKEENDSESSEDEYEAVPETDAERRQTLFSSEDSKDTLNLKDKVGSRAAWKAFEKDFNFGSVKSEEPKPGIAESSSTGVKRSNGNGHKMTRIATPDVIDISSDDDDLPELSCDAQAPSGSTGTIAGTGSSRIENPSVEQSKSSSTSKKALGKRKDQASHVSQGSHSQKSSTPTTNWSANTSSGGRKTPVRGHEPLGLGNLVKTEIEFRKKEAIGLAGRRNAGGRMLGESRPSDLDGTSESRPVSRLVSESASNVKGRFHQQKFDDRKWACLVCTL